MYKKDIKLCKGTIKGYLYFYDMSHPLANKAGIVYLHRHLASIYVNRWLKKNEVVHHCDEDKLNNVIDNLKIMSRREHAIEHFLQDGGTEKKCPLCSSTFYNKKLKFCSKECFVLSGHARKVKERPPRAELLKALSNMSYCALGRKYGVSDNTIRKWLK